MRKEEIDVLAAREVGEALETVSPITKAFLRELSRAIADGNTVTLWGFGKFSLVKSTGSMPPHAPFGGGTKRGTTTNKFKVYFMKSSRFKEEIWRKHTERINGQVRRG